MIKTIVNEYSENTYILNYKNTAYIIDPGAHFQEIKKYIDDLNLDVKAVLITHGHFDHIYSLNELIDEYNPLIYIHELERDFLFSSSLNLSSMITKQFKISKKDTITVVKDDEIITLGNESIKVIHTPGHTRGSVCFKYKKYLFTGDTLFKGTVGRTDLPTGNKAHQKKSLEKLKRQIKDNTVLYPGHGEMTTMLNEKYDNEYLV